MEPREEYFTFYSDGLCLEAVIHKASSPHKALAFIAHPHPHYGGDMDNPVVLAIAKGMARGGVIACRFNFPGAGKSQGHTPADGSESRHALEALNAAALKEGAGALPKLACGYSFGSWIALRLMAETPSEFAGAFLVAPPIALYDLSFAEGLQIPMTVVSGEFDQYSRPEVLQCWKQKMPNVRLISIPGVDHFFSMRGADRQIETLAHDFSMELPPVNNDTNNS